MALTNLREKLGAALGIKSGEFLTAFSLFCYLFLIIASYVISKTVRDALFLTEFGALNLPYVYVGIAIFVSFFVAVYLRLGRWLRPRVLVCWTLLFFLSNVVLFWWLVHLGLSWLYPVVYIWVGVFGVIAPMQVWMLASLFLTTRQAKRLYGFIGSGGLLGAIVGGLLSSWMVKQVGTENLLLLLVFFLAACVWLTNLGWWQTPGETAGESAERGEESPGSLCQSISLIMRSQYLLLITAIISIGAMATTLADYQFKAVAEQTFVTKDQLTAFFGRFYGYLGIGAVLLQLLLTSRMMRRLGIGFTLFLLPLGLVLGSVAVLSYVTLWSVTLLKGTDQLFKHSVDKSSLELLYLPLPVKIRTAAKSFIDTVVWRLADAAAGLVLLLLISFFSLSLRQITLVNLFFLLGWLVVAHTLRRKYVDALRSAISGRACDSKPAKAKAPTASFDHLPEERPQPATKAALSASGLTHAPGSEDQARWKRAYPGYLELARLLQDSSAQVAQQALQWAAELQRLELVPLIIAHLGRKETSALARQTLIGYGSKILGTLRDHLVSEEVAIEVRRTIPAIISEIETQEAVDLLASSMDQQDPRLRLTIMKALNKLRAKASPLKFPTARVRQELIYEVKNYYLALSLLQAKLSGQSSTDASSDCEPLQRRMEERLESVLERIFRLLGLIYPPQDLDQAYHGLLSDDLTVRANALELLDNLLKSDDRQWLLPLVDEEMPPTDRLAVARSISHRRARQQVQSADLAAWD